MSRELAPVQVAPLGSTPLVQPKKMSLDACINRWPSHDALPGLV